MNSVQTLKISISGVRGVVGESLTPDLLVRFAESFGTYRRGGRIVIGRDTRTSGEMVENAVLSGLISAGCQVTGCGIAPVPTIQYMVRRLGADGGIAITASHNPAQWNALKFIREDGCFLNHYQARELIDIYHQGDYRKVGGREQSAPVANTRAAALHAEHIFNVLGKLSARKKKPTVVVDCVNGAASVMSPEFLRRLGCRVVPIHCVPDGRFPRPPEPLPQNLGALCDAVKQHKADIGFAQDADADRLAVVDETGTPIGEDYTLALAVDAVLSREKGAVVVNLATSRAVDDVAARHGCRIVKSKIGEINVTEMMKQENAVVGGEGNGGVIYPAVNMARDSFTGMALILRLMAEKQQPLSRIVAALPRYVMRKSAVPCPLDRALDVVETLSARHTGKNIDRSDGLKIHQGKKWALVRPSNTEPILRIVTDAPTAKEAEALNMEYQKLIGDILRQ